MVKPVDAWLLPDGVADVLPVEAARLEALRRRLLDHFNTWGYDLVFPPLMEFLESLLTGSGRDLADLTFKITDQLSGRLMGVRADMTPQVARLDAHCIPNTGVARYCYAGSLLQTRPSGLSASRCPVQIGAELYGHAGVDSDIEVVQLMLSSLQLAGATDVCLDIGHVGLFRALVEVAQLPADIEAELHELLRRKALPAWQTRVPELVEAPALRAVLLQLPMLAGDLTVLDHPVLAQPGLPAAVSAALAELRALALAVSVHQPSVSVHVDLGELRGYHYHTGLVFAAYVPGVAVEVAKGGRYDHVGEAFGRARPATGFSADLKQWLDLVEGHPMTVADLIVAPAGREPALQAAIAALRATGERVVQALPGATETDGAGRRLQQIDGCWQVVASNVTE